MSRFLQRFQTSSKKSFAGLALVTTATAVAAWVAYRSRRAGRDNPAEGQFIEVDGVRLHYVDVAQHRIAEAVSATPAVIPWAPEDAMTTAQAEFAE